MLKQQTYKTEDGEEYRLQEISLYRVMQYQKLLKEAGDDEQKVFDLTSALIRRSVIKADGTPLWTEEAFKDDVSPRLANWIQTKISELSGMTESTESMVEDEVKNSTATTA